MSVYSVQMFVPFLEGDAILRLSPYERIAMYEQQIFDSFADIKVFMFKNGISGNFITEPIRKPEFIIVTDQIDDLLKCKLIGAVEEMDLHYVKGK